MFDNLFWSLYWIDVFSSLGIAVSVGILLASVVGLLCAGFCYDVLKYTSSTALKRGFLVFSIVLVLALVGSLIPSKPTMYMMLGVKATKDFTETETGKKLEKYINEQLAKLLKQ